MVKGRSHDVPPSVAAFAERLSHRVRAALPRWEWAWHPEWRSSREELQQDLDKNGIPEWPFLWPLEDAFAGAQVELGGWDLSFGISAEDSWIERAKLSDKHDQMRFVSIADYGNDILVADATGRVCQLAEDGTLTALAPSFESFLEYHAMSTWFADWSPTLFSADLLPRTAGSAVAAHLGVPPVPEAFNDIFRWWQDDTLTLFTWVNDDLPAMAWAKTLVGLVKGIDAAAHFCPTLKIKPNPSYDDQHKEILNVEEIRARAPSVETLAARPGARRIELIGEPSIFPGKPPSTGDVWISGEGETLRIEVLERREGEVVNYWQLTPTGSHALLMSTYGHG
jgi:hypothetical protein